MAHYKLTYFNHRSRGELARIILHCAQVPFEDNRIPRAEWDQIKPNMSKMLPFNQVPILEENGKVLAQSHTICRYLARKHGLAGKNDWEAPQADMFADCIYDQMDALKPILIKEKDEAKKKERFLKHNKESAQPHLAIIEQHLIKNGSGYLVGNTLSWADLAYYTFFVPLAEKWGNELILPNSPHLKKLFDKIGTMPQIRQYIEMRPKTDI